MRPTRTILLIFALAIGCSGRSSETKSSDASKITVTILAAASLSESLERIAKTIQQQHPEIAITISTGPSNGLAQQILVGAEADLFFSASRKWADEVQRNGLAEGVVDVLSNKLVLIVPKGNPAGLQSLSDVTPDNVSHFAMASENVPAGTYAGQSLAKLGLLQPLEAAHRIVRGNDVRATLAFVEHGEAEAGIVYATDARLSKDVTVISELDPTTHDPIVYTLVLLRKTSESQPADAATKVYRALQVGSAIAEFESFGFSRLPQDHSSSIDQP